MNSTQAMAVLLGGIAMGWFFKPTAKVEPRTRSETKRTIASLEKPLILKEKFHIEKTSLNEKVHQTSDKKNAKPELTKDQMWESLAKNTRDRLSQETLSWSQKFPVPRNRQEDELLLQLQMSHEKKKVIVISPPTNEKFKEWDNVDSLLDVYIESCLNRMDFKTEHFERMSLTKFSSIFRYQADLTKYVLEDVQAFTENPSLFNINVYDDLIKIVGLNYRFSSEDYSEILEQLSKSLKSTEVH